MSAALSHELWRFLRNIDDYLGERLVAPSPPSELFLRWVTPLSLIRTTAVFLRGVWVGDLSAAMVLATGNFAHLIGVWLTTGFVLPVITKQFGETINDSSSFAVVTYASVPLWLAGILYVIPEETSFLFIWSRGLVALIGLSGIYVLHRALCVLGLRARILIVVATTLSFAVAYGFLFMVAGLSSMLLMFLLRTATDTLGA